MGYQSHLRRSLSKESHFSKEPEKLETEDEYGNNKTRKINKLCSVIHRRFTFGMKTREKVLTKIHKSKNHDVYRRSSFSHKIPLLIMFIKQEPIKISNQSKHYLDGNNYIL